MSTASQYIHCGKLDFRLCHALLVVETIILVHKLSLQVNNNGDLSFTTRVSTFTPQAFPLSGNLQLIAPYWADVDTRGTGSVWYRETTDPQLLTRARNEIQSAFIDQARFSPTSLFIATWDHVGYYNRRTDKARFHNIYS